MGEVGMGKISYEYRVFVNGKTAESVRKKSAKKYGAYNYVVTQVKLDKKKPPKSARMRGLTKRYKVYLRKSKR